MNQITKQKPIKKSSSKAPLRLKEHIVEIISDSGEGAQRCGQALASIAARMGNGVWTVEIIPAEIRPPAASPAAAAIAFVWARVVSPMAATKPTW